jgi:hypothetical protein
MKITSQGAEGAFHLRCAVEGVSKVGDSAGSLPAVFIFSKCFGR